MVESAFCIDDKLISQKMLAQNLIIMFSFHSTVQKSNIYNILIIVFFSCTVIKAHIYENVVGTQVTQRNYTFVLSTF